ncbi:hypothetical protein [Legionella tunisiensis]|uniref:hypothetical protein n=1 Tax=Legionella tunisiensis TaxID=1034944 RepID=UPI00037ABE2F|nr:hypothetical protein [Legionella tunisiensis]
MMYLIEECNKNIKGYNFNLMIYGDTVHFYGKAIWADECINLTHIKTDFFQTKEEAKEKLINKIESLDSVRLGILGTTHPKCDENGSPQKCSSICYRCRKEIKSNDSFSD